MQSLSLITYSTAQQLHDHHRHAHQVQYLMYADNCTSLNFLAATLCCHLSCAWLHRTFGCGDPTQTNLQQLLLSQVQQSQSPSNEIPVHAPVQKQQSQEVQPSGNAAGKNAWAVLYSLISSQANNPEHWEVWEDAQDADLASGTDVQVLVATLCAL